MRNKNGRRHNKRQFNAIRRTGGKRLNRAIKRVTYRLAETKFLINAVTLNTTLDAANPILQPLAVPLPQGNTAFTRIGQRVNVKTYFFKFKFTFNYATLGRTAGFFRIMLLYPRKTQTNQSVSASIAVSPPGLYQRADPTIMMTLYDKFYVLGGISGPSVAGVGVATLSGSQPTLVQPKYAKRARKANLIYENATNTTPRCPLLYIVTDLAAGDTSDILWNGYYGMSFKDI